MIDNLEEILNGITDKLVAEFNPLKIYLIGSYAWGKPDNDSDIDLMIILNESKDARHLRATKAYKAIREFSFIPIDILVRTEEEFNKYSLVPASFKNKISEKVKLLYAR